MSERMPSAKQNVNNGRRRQLVTKNIQDSRMKYKLFNLLLAPVVFVVMVVFVGKMIYEIIHEARR